MLTAVGRSIVLISVDAFQVVHAKQLKQYITLRVEFLVAVLMLHSTVLPVMDNLTGPDKDYRHY
jgi:hypothetical protein